jgi:hypothetical protein
MAIITAKKAKLIKAKCIFALQAYRLEKRKMAQLKELAYEFQE